MISVNRNNIKHALINVLMNCIQASEENGVVYVTVQACCDVVRVYIKDNGPGINKEDIEKVFEPFYTTKKGGTGLGLSSTYKIIKEHGGRITVNSPPGEGTQFDIVLER
jgi:signal transduction histidine kinase